LVGLWCEWREIPINDASSIFLVLGVVEISKRALGPKNVHITRFDLFRREKFFEQIKLIFTEECNSIK